MLVENMMYFALGALAAALLALIILPAVWRRAVRLTKRRIEAATPMSMAEFRADKDQLRAEFALSTRRLEMNVEQLRQRLAEQLSEVARKQADLAGLDAERENHANVLRELAAREAELRERILELEREGTDLNERLRQRDQEIAGKAGELAQMRQALKGMLPHGNGFDDSTLSGDYDQDTDRLVTNLAIERQRSLLLEEKARNLIARLEGSDRRSAAAKAAIAEMRKALEGEGEEDGASKDLVAAEARIASAENRLSALLGDGADEGAASANRSLAETLSIEEQLEAVRTKVGAIEQSAATGVNGKRATNDALREKLGDIATEVSRLVYTLESGPGPENEEESLFDRVQRFADDGVKVETLPLTGSARDTRSARGRLADRMAALREIQGAEPG